MVALCSCCKELLPKPQAALSLESFGVADLCESKGAVLRQLSPIPGPVSLICNKTQCIFFCTGTATKKTFCRPAKMMDYVEAHLCREKAETGSEKVRCRHPVCKSARLVLEDVHDFKNHVKDIHDVALRKPWHMRRGSGV
ncbi:hypothetical protein OIDMADRAFT_55964 [Oidiodendron maius Zn]|uniref:Uncharacterized protein n=1 Tax=Oidiodendron maius (strain Zn) TaxID=913774 RepID=A0A0C3DDN7_OIDMZ|nr:hypothetical protein OIDMADRAFT_55964 [Oidiodendron maius Zn]